MAASGHDTCVSNRPISEGNATYFDNMTSPFGVYGHATFSVLEVRFTATGRGNRMTPKDLPVTNRLLLQLQGVQEKHGKTEAEMNSWFKMLFPDIVFPTSRLSRLMRRIHSQLTTLQKKACGDDKSFLDKAPEMACEDVKSFLEQERKKACGDVKSFLDKERDLDFISNSLSKLGLRRRELNAEIKCVIVPENFRCTNELVVDLKNFQKSEGYTLPFITNWMCLVCGDCVTDKSIRKIIAQHQKLSQLYKKTPEKITEFLNIVFPAEDITPPAPSLASQPGTATTEVRQLGKAGAAKRMLTEKCEKLTTRINDLEAVVLEVGQKNKELMCVPNTIGKLTETVVKLQDRLYRQKRNSNLRFEAKRRQWNDAHRKIQRQEIEQSELRVERDSLVQQMAEKNAELERVKKENLLLTQENQALSVDRFDIDTPIQTIKTKVRKENNRYTDPMRMTVLRLQADAKVPASRCSSTIKIVAEHLFDCVLQDSELPCLQTAVNIADEGHVLAKIQATEKILTSEKCTLHMDGTSRDHKKIVGQQITLSSGETLSLGFTSVCSEDAATLLDMTISQLQEMGDLYCDYREEDREQVFREVLGKLTSFMTDRAAVMKKFDADFLSFIRTQLGQDTVIHFLHCNAHYLLGQSRAADAALKEIEAAAVKASGKLGRDNQSKYRLFHTNETATSRLIRTASDCVGPRGDQKNGCRVEWLAYCQEKGLVSQMTSYRSNRFNSYFEGAAAIIHHRASLSSFFKSLSHSNLKTQSVEADLEDKRMLVFIAAVALLYLRVSGPYWELLQSHVKYHQFHQYINPMVASFQRWSEDASQLMDAAFTGVFDGHFELGEKKATLKTSVFSFIHDEEVGSDVKGVLEQMMRPLLDVTHNQLKDFIAGNIYGGPPAPIPEGMDHCPLTNLLGENVFGDLDYDMGVKRNATNHHRTSTHILGHNKTGDWMCHKSTEEASKLLKFARKRGPQLRQQHRRQEQMVMLKIREKMAADEQKKNLRQAKVTETRQQLLQRLLELGGPCMVPADVDRLVRRLREEKNVVIVEALKDNIRYQKTVLNKRGDLKLSGTKPELILALRKHLSEDGGEDIIGQLQDPDSSEDEELYEPPEKRPCNGEPDEDDDVFTFTNQGMWVAVYYDQGYYIGQVLEVKPENTAVIQFLEQTKGRSDYYRWPRADDAAVVKALYVFRWGFDVNPVSSDGRVWQVCSQKEIAGAYAAINSRK